jgi:UDP-glucose 4-epimerase
LIAAGYKVIGLDNLSNSVAAVVARIATITGIEPCFIEGDVRDTNLLNSIFSQHKIDAAIHFAALKAVGESVQQPLAYYDNNLSGLITLLNAMQLNDVRTFIFSSSATVYGDPASVPIKEHFPLSATNPYGQTKLMSEQILRDVEIAYEGWGIGYLRYFNPVGAHESGLIGEAPNGTPNNLMPYVAQVAAGKLDKLKVHGSDYPTHDGTGVRDYIHVMDLARGHVMALTPLLNGGKSFTVNLGTGQGYSVLDVVRAYEQASGRSIPYELGPRRPGDVASCYADVSLSREMLGWQASKELLDMCQDSWRWQSMNLNGFNDA